MGKIICVNIPCNAFEDLCDIVTFPDNTDYFINGVVVNPNGCIQGDASILVTTNLPELETQWTWYKDGIPFTVTPPSTTFSLVNLDDGTYKLEGLFSGNTYTYEVTIDNGSIPVEPLNIIEVITNVNNN